MPISSKSVNHIIDAVCEYYGTTREYITKKGRVSKQVSMRMVCQWLLITEGQLTKTAVAHLFNQDHSTIVHTFQRINNFIQVGDYVKQDIQNIRNNYL